MISKSIGLRLKIVWIGIWLAAISAGCSDDSGENDRPDRDYPTGITREFKITYTDSGKVKMIITSPLHKDFSNREFAYNDFPEGLKVEILNAQGETSLIEANSAKIFQSNNIIELRGNVIIHIGKDDKVLKTPLLYWDRSNNWIFTEEDFTFINSEDGTVMDGTGIEFSRNFNDMIAHKVNGKMLIKKSDEEQL